MIGGAPSTTYLCNGTPQLLDCCWIYEVFLCVCRRLPRNPSYLTISGLLAGGHAGKGRLALLLLLTALAAAQVEAWLEELLLPLAELAGNLKERSAPSLSRVTSQVLCDQLCLTLAEQNLEWNEVAQHSLLFTRPAGSIRGAPASAAECLCCSTASPYICLRMSVCM